MNNCRVKRTKPRVAMAVTSPGFRFQEISPSFWQYPLPCLVKNTMTNWPVNHTSLVLESQLFPSLFFQLLNNEKRTVAKSLSKTNLHFGVSCPILQVLNIWNKIKNTILLLGPLRTFWKTTEKNITTWRNRANDFFHVSLPVMFTIEIIEASSRRRKTSCWTSKIWPRHRRTFVWVAASQTVGIRSSNAVAFWATKERREGWK